MKEKIEILLQQCLENASEEEQNILYQILNGVLRKKQNSKRTYISELLHMDIEVNEHQCTVTIPINKLTENILHIVHGGITATTVDTAMGLLANEVVPEGYGAVTSNLTIHYIAPGVGESIRATAQIIHKGSKTLIVEGIVHRNDGKKIAHCTGTFFVVKK
jgi:uncharacterized protein (TIGR00369 family)